MKGMRFSILILLALSLALMPALAVAESALPTPRPSVSKQFTLPNFGSISGDTGDMIAEDYAYDNAQWTIYYFEQTANWGNEVGQWLDACDDREFERSMSIYEGNTGYRVTRDGLSAILIPGLNDQIMLMVQEGLEMDAFAEAAEDALKLGEVRVTYNGKKYTDTSAGKPFYNEPGGFYDAYAWVGGELNSVRFYIPKYVETGTHEHFTSYDTDKHYLLDLGTNANRLVDFWYKKFQGTSNNDYFDVTIYYRDQREVYGVYDGCFNDGADVITVEFYLSL